MEKTLNELGAKGRKRKALEEDIAFSNQVDDNSTYEDQIAFWEIVSKYHYKYPDKIDINPKPILDYLKQSPTPTGTDIVSDEEYNLKIEQLKGQLLSTQDRLTQLENRVLDLSAHEYSKERDREIKKRMNQIEYHSQKLETLKQNYDILINTKPEMTPGGVKGLHSEYETEVLSSVNNVKPTLLSFLGKMLEEIDNFKKVQGEIIAFIKQDAVGISNFISNISPTLQEYFNIFADIVKEYQASGENFKEKLNLLNIPRRKDEKSTAQQLYKQIMKGFTHISDKLRDSKKSAMSLGDSLKEISYEASSYLRVEPDPIKSTETWVVWRSPSDEIESWPFFLRTIAASVNRERRRFQYTATTRPATDLDPEPHPGLYLTQSDEKEMGTFSIKSNVELKEKLVELRNKYNTAENYTEKLKYKEELEKLISYGREQGLLY